MTSGYLGLLMLGLIVVAIMMGFPTAFTLMGLGMLFGYVAYFDPTQSMVANRIFDLMVQRTYGGMTNDTLLSIPLFVLMGYVIERAALVDKMFRAVQLSFRRLPAPLRPNAIIARDSISRIPCLKLAHRILCIMRIQIESVSRSRE